MKTPANDQKSGFFNLCVLCIIDQQNVQFIIKKTGHFIPLAGNGKTI